MNNATFSVRNKNTVIVHNGNFNTADRFSNGIALATFGRLSGNAW